MKIGKNQTHWTSAAVGSLIAIITIIIVAQFTNACKNLNSSDASLRDQFEDEDSAELVKDNFGSRINIPQSIIHMQVCEKELGPIPLIVCNKPIKDKNGGSVDLTGGESTDDLECEHGSIVPATGCQKSRFIWQKNGDTQWVAMCRNENFFSKPIPAGQLPNILV